MKNMGADNETGAGDHPLAGMTLERGKPIAGQIVSRLIGLVTSGGIAAGTRLPSIRGLAAQLGVNRNTVAHSFRELAEKGYLRSRFGGGSTIHLPPPVAVPVNSQPGPSFLPPGALAPMSETDWERMFAVRLNGFMAGGQPSLFPPNQPSPINLYQLRPDTGIFPLERFRQCLNTVLRRSGRHLLNYGAPAGFLPLREQIARRLAASGIQADPSQVLVMSGSQQGIDLLARAFLNPGDGVVVEAPAYSIALKIFAANGAKFHPYPIGRDGAGLDALKQLGGHGSPKLFYAVPNFQNPTTHSYTLEEKQGLLREACRLGSVVVEDASDLELHADPARWPPLASMDATGRVIHVNTFSKTLVPAVRMGYIRAPATLVRRLSELKEMTDLSQSLILQGAVAEFMERGYFDEHVENVRAVYRARMERVLEMLSASLPADAPHTRPDGGLCVWVDLPSHVNADRLFDALRVQGVLVSPGSLYQPPNSPRNARNGIRLCVSNEPEERLAEGFKILGRELERALRQPPPTPAEEEYQPMH